VLVLQWARKKPVKKVDRIEITNVKRVEHEIMKKANVKKRSLERRMSEPITPSRVVGGSLFTPPATKHNAVLHVPVMSVATEKVKSSPATTESPTPTPGGEAHAHRRLSSSPLEDGQGQGYAPLNHSQTIDEVPIDQPGTHNVRLREDPTAMGVYPRPVEAQILSACSLTEELRAKLIAERTAFGDFKAFQVSLDAFFEANVKYQQQPEAYSREWRNALGELQIWRDELGTKLQHLDDLEAKYGIVQGEQGAGGGVANLSLSQLQEVRDVLFACIIQRDCAAECKADMIALEDEHLSSEAGGKRGKDS
jgi:hypothetical protein